jgi:lipopolysaccharide cholinephosphotransferase
MNSDGIDLEGIAWIQDRVRELLAELNRIATSESLPYYLAYGTAIGAVRDGDLIPWDPDADVLVPVNSYDRMISAIRARISDKFEVVDSSTAGYEYLFARLAVRGIDHKYVRVDIFPLCSAPNGAIARRLFTVVQRTLAKTYLIKKVDLGKKTHYSRRKALLVSVARMLTAFVSPALLRRSFALLLGNFMIDAGSKFLTNPSGSYGAREYFPAAWFSQSTESLIDGIPHPMPVGYDAWLRQIYGDYMSPVSSAEIDSALAFATQHFVAPLRRSGWFE